MYIYIYLLIHPIDYSWLEIFATRATVVLLKPTHLAKLVSPPFTTLGRSTRRPRGSSSPWASRNPWNSTIPCVFKWFLESRPNGKGISVYQTMGVPSRLVDDGSW